MLAEGAKTLPSTLTGCVKAHGDALNDALDFGKLRAAKLDEKFVAAEAGDKIARARDRPQPPCDLR